MKYFFRLVAILGTLGMGLAGCSDDPDLSPDTSVSRPNLPDGAEKVEFLQNECNQGQGNSCSELDIAI
ncbi:MAG: hypothetical protein RLZZ69_1275 [Cyanobacteriota bacterium]